MIKTIALLVFIGIGSNGHSYIKHQGYDTIEQCHAQVPDAKQDAVKRFCDGNESCADTVRAYCAELEQPIGTNGYYLMQRK